MIILSLYFNDGIKYVGSGQFFLGSVFKCLDIRKFYGVIFMEEREDKEMNWDLGIEFQS